MALRLTVGALASAYDAGQVVVEDWRKAPTIATAAGIWVDLSMSPGRPSPNYYAAAPLVSVAMARSTHGGLDHGPDASGGAQKFIHGVSVATSIATGVGVLRLLDYLLFYPFVEMSDSTDLIQGDALPRYTDGAGVKIMPVLVAPQGGGATFYLEYTNSSGVSGRVTPTVTCNAQVVSGTVITSATATAGCPGPFVPLQSGDTGVRQIDRVVWVTPDVGLVTFVLVKQVLPDIGLYSLAAPNEIDYMRDYGWLPPIEPDAYLNWLCKPNGTVASSAFYGYLSTLWST